MHVSLVGVGYGMCTCRCESIFTHSLLLTFPTQVTKNNTLGDETLKQDFQGLCEHLIGNSLQAVDCPPSLIDEVFTELLSRVINTMMNSLLQCAAMVKRIEANKGVDADVALRDKLKVYASESLVLDIRLYCYTMTLSIIIQLLLF